MSNAFYTCLWKSCKSVQFFHNAKHLQTDCWHYNSKSGYKYHQTSKFFPDPNMLYTKSSKKGYVFIS